MQTLQQSFDAYELAHNTLRKALHSALVSNGLIPSSCKSITLKTERHYKQDLDGNPAPYYTYQIKGKSDFLPSFSREFTREQLEEILSAQR